MPDSPLAYFLTFTCYGTWLHGRQEGSVDDNHNQVDTPFLPANHNREYQDHRRMTEPAFTMDRPRRLVVLATIQEVSHHRNWDLLAAHVRSTHVHVVARGNSHPDKIAKDYKAYATRRLIEAGFDLERQRRWTEGCSTRYLWKENQVYQKVYYVVLEQGNPMELFVADEFHSLCVATTNDSSEPEA